MREILFRGKIKNKEKWMEEGEWIEGSLLYQKYEDNEVCKIAISYLSNENGESRALAYDVFPKTVGQYTGMADRNGRRYEGDIFQASDGDYIQRYIIVWNEDSFEWYAQCIGNPDQSLSLSEFRAEEIEVIGNIFDNPELIA